ncbi:MAG: hypothetical protein KDE47_10820 [Caldilineaceae bacterium]|nr:hypothetical protein [Caldilineaceae bacterium]MCB0081418.1 hypothetical protein [Caldilineaceae bacterium]
MPTTNVTAEISVDELLNAVAKLDKSELARFEVGYEQIWRHRSSMNDSEALKIVESHRLSPQQQIRLRELLFKNREDSLTAAEEQELDFYMTTMDQALENTADELLRLAASRQQIPNTTP